MTTGTCSCGCGMMISGWCLDVQRLSAQPRSGTEPHGEASRSVHRFADSTSHRLFPSSVENTQSPFSVLPPWSAVYSVVRLLVRYAFANRILGQDPPSRGVT